MNKLSFLAIASTLLLLYSSCKKEKIDDDPIVIDTPKLNIAGSKLYLKNILAYLPNQYETNKNKVVFKNENNQELLLTIEKETRRGLQKITKPNGDVYEGEHRGFGLRWPDSLFKLTIALDIRHVYNDKYSPTEMITIISYNKPYPLLLNLFYDEKFKSLTNGNEDLSITQVKLNNRTFSKVYTNSIESEKMLTEVYYNKEFGICGFKENGVMWNFDRFE